MQQTVPNTVFERIRTDLNANDVVLFMKGSAVFPQCGFSAMVVSILQSVSVKFKDHNVLANEELRQGIISCAMLSRAMRDQ